MKSDTFSSTVQRAREAGLVIAAFGMVCAISGCERPPVESLQGGYRGLAMTTLINPRSDAAIAAKNQVPAVIPAASPDGPLASTVYSNVRVLKDLNVAEFTRVMLAMTQWVAPPDQSCSYCHTSDMSSDDKYTKVVARRMIQMVRHINTHWKDHVGKTGVTCYTCHRGQNNPSQIWFTGAVQGPGAGLAEADMGKNLPTDNADGSSLPSDPFTPYLLNDQQIRVNGDTALPTGNRSSMKQTEWTYALMMHYSTALGVSCEFCHNSRAIQDWSESTPQRVTAYYAEGMLRDLNRNYMVPLTPVFPAAMLGPTGDVAKINCATCHQGVYKPLFGAAMAQSFPALEGVAK